MVNHKGRGSDLMVSVLAQVVQKVNNTKGKSAFEPSGPSGRSLSRFLYHEATGSISTLPWMEC